MSKLRSYISKINFVDLAISSNIKYGNAIFERKSVHIIKETETEIELWAGGLMGNMTEGGGTKRKVRLWLEGTEFHWRCTGNPKNHEIFCKHCVAAALFLKGE